MDGRVLGWYYGYGYGIGQWGDGIRSEYGMYGTKLWVRDGFYSIFHVRGKLAKSNKNH